MAVWNLEVQACVLSRSVSSAHSLFERLR
jgi:hypothetical protein